MNKGRETLLELFYRYLSKVKSMGHALLVSGIFASACSLLSLLGTSLAFQKFDSSIQPIVMVLAYTLPFILVLGTSFLLIRGFVALEQHNKALSEEVDRDSLTRLANRTAFVRRGREMVTQSGLQKTPLSLILLDADHFKAINDTHGHLAGDLALQHLAEILRQTSRDSDLVARWGGEEFAILLKSADILGAQTFAERLRELVAQSPFFWDGREVSLTMSAGVTEWKQDGDDLQSMIQRADEALYVAKSAGRNQVHLSHHYIQEVEGFEQDVQFREVVA